MKNNKVFITLQNGKQFQGYRFGADGDVVGELVFTTGMTGYIETLTDPSYYGQIVTQTFPLIGNYGYTPDEESKKPWVSAYIVREKCDMPSNFRCEGTLDGYMKEKGVVGVYGIDTRELTKIVRDCGVMNAVISSNPNPDTNALSTYTVKDAVKSVTCSEVEYFGNENGLRVVVWDFGVKAALIRSLTKRGCYCIKVPSYYTAEQILALNPNGLLLGNGPGDPAENTEVIINLKKLISRLPIFGIGLGHQLFALAMDGQTRKMKYGHRGSNQPVKDLQSDRVYISCQNHGYEVISSSLEGKGELRFANANDNTCEGIDYPNVNAFTVQFYPEAGGGVHDAAFLFDRFVKNMQEGKYNA